MNTGWQTKKLSDVCQIKPPKKEAKELLSESDLVSFVPMHDLGIRQKSLNHKEEKTLAEVVGSYTYFADNDVLLAKITPCFENGKLGIAQGLKNGIGFGSSEYIVFRSKDDIDPEYLFYFLSQDSFRGAGAKVMTGAVGHKRVPKEFIENHQIPLPNLDEQKRIVAILDEAFAGIDTAIANTEKNLANARELFESYLNNVFTQRGVGWKETKLRDICNIKHGFAFKSEFFVEDSDYVVLTPGSFYESGGFRDQGKKTKYYQGEIPDGYLMDKGEFLVAMTEQAAGLLGSSLIIPEAGKYLHNQRLGLVKLFAGVQWHNDFFFHQFNTREFRDAVQLSASGVKVRHTSPTKLGEIDICFPPTIDKQKDIADRLNEIQEEARKLESSYRQKLTVLNELKQSLLQKAFSGELTAGNAAPNATRTEEKVA